MSTPVWMGLIFDRTGSYFWALLPLSAIYALSAIGYLAAAAAPAAGPPAGPGRGCRYAKPDLKIVAATRIESGDTGSNKPTQEVMYGRTVGR